MKKHKLYLVNILMIIGLIILAACGDQGANEAEVTNENDEQVADEEIKVAAFPFTHKDASNTEITIEEKPERIVSLVPSITETLFTLGLGDEIIGVSDFDNYPPEVEEKERIGGVIDFNVEQIIHMKPDLVFGDNRMEITNEGYEQLREAGITVVVLHADNSFADVYDNIELMSQLTGTQENAEDIITNMQSKIEEIKNTAAEIENEEQPKVFIEIDPEGWTVGKGTFMNEMLEMLGATNVSGHDEGAFIISEEEVVRLNPDVIIFVHDFDNPVESVYNRDGWQHVTAIEEEQVYLVETDLVNRPGPRLADGLEEFAKVIYPDVFGE